MPPSLKASGRRRPVWTPAFWRLHLNSVPCPLFGQRAHLRLQDTDGVCLRSRGWTCVLLADFDRRSWRLIFFFFLSFCLALLCCASCCACSDVWQSPALTFKFFIITLFYFSHPPTRSLGRKFLFFFSFILFFPPSAVTVNEESVSLIHSLVNWRLNY